MKEPHWLRKDFVLTLHELLLAEFGGSPGLRDDGLIESALGRPQHLFHYSRADCFSLAAAYAYGIVSNHPFIDGNKRTGFMAAYTFLGRNGFELVGGEAEATAATLALAAGELDEKAYAQWLREESRPKD